MLYFNSFCNSPTLVEKLFDRGIYFPGTIGGDQKKYGYYEKR